jgi:hypothetical protein
MEYSYKKSEIIPIDSPNRNNKKCHIDEQKECSVNSSNFNPFSSSPPNDFMAKLEQRYFNQISSTHVEKKK